MAIIRSGESTTLWTIDPASKAGRVTLYRDDGTTIFPEFGHSLVARIEVIPTTLTLGTTYWAMRNTGTKLACLKKIELSVGFSGSVAASRSVYEIERFTTATPTGGTVIVPARKDTTKGTSYSVGDIRYAPGGLTTTGVVFDPPFHQIANTNQLNNDRFLSLLDSTGDNDYAWFTLQPGEGLCIRAYTAVIAGSYLVGAIYWYETP